MAKGEGCLSTRLGGIELKNPVLLASGTFAYAEEISQWVDLNRVGGLITKTITLKPRAGNPPPRLAETPCGLLNAIGLENPGIEGFLKSKLPFLLRFKVPIIVSIAGEDKQEYVELARKLQREGVAGLELNISCPNIARKEGRMISQDEKATYSLTRAVRRETSLPLVVKLSPNVGDISAIAKSAEEAGADILSLVNTFLGMAIDIDRRKPKLGNVIGGLSGPAIKPLVLRAVYEVAQEVKIPIIGMGGIMRWQDALEFILAGASAVAVGTANLINPLYVVEIIEGLKGYLQKEGIGNIEELRAGLEE
ncbi:MAG: dihydroorotate dehydrogenase [Candidatus Omnitrophota bacterium]|nr:MAG: dihydroorotate dehydrogenase [Candidatus Omnitrophota bacterium]